MLLRGFSHRRSLERFAHPRQPAEQARQAQTLASVVIATGEIVPSDEVLAGTWSWVEVKDHDHFVQTWTLSKAGKDVPKVFTFERVK